MHQDLKFRPAKEALDQAWFAPHPFHGVAQFTPELREVEAAAIAEFDPFEVLPEQSSSWLTLLVNSRSSGKSALYTMLKAIETAGIP